MSFERLIAEHHRIEQLAIELIGVIDAPADVTAAEQALAHLAFELQEHLAYEDSFIYPQLINSRCQSVSDDANAFVAEFASLAADWGQYLKDWVPDCIAADWPSFQAETRAILVRLARRVEQENDLLYPHALQQGCISLRDMRQAA